MEVVDVSSRQSAVLPSINLLDLEKLKRDSTERYEKHPSVPALNMSTASLISPTTMYSGPPPPYSYSSSTASSVTGLAGYISPPESRRTSENDKDPPTSHRHSLPSIHEALAADQPLSYAAPPSASALPSQNHHPASILTPTTPIPRSHPETSPQGPPNPFSGQSHGAYSAHSSQARTSQLQQAPSTPSDPKFPAINPHESKFQHLQPVRTSQPHIESLRPSVQSLLQSRTSPVYDSGPSSASSMNPQKAYNSYQPSYPYQLPPSTIAPSTYHPPDPYHGTNIHPTTWRSDGSEINRAEEGRKAASRGGSLGGQAYGESVKRHLDIFDLETSLNEIAEGSGRMLDFSRHYSAHAHQTQRSGPIPGSLPTLLECDEMIRQHGRVYDSFARIREVLLTQQLALAEQRQHDQGYKGSSEYDEDGVGYQDELKGGGGFAGADAKKRRGVSYSFDNAPTDD
ncbi:MAG: hypothetical protein M1830_000685 [Pleopsidium flavum]|nr:MAG: hypothetical protein M1830_000685 [Pleopsidium flavum]